MQGVNVDEQNRRKSHNDDELLNLRPSPNYKHKKYLRSKFEEAMMNEAGSSLLGHNKRDKVIAASAAAQPPLPPNPPPDSPPMIINLKQEIEDDDYPTRMVETVSALKQPDDPSTKNAADTNDRQDKLTMCRNFARGTCRKGQTCIFAHELILSQLPGVYTFCRNFQNSVCSFPKCKFVHATVFEKEHFFRTGFLPPHTLAHLEDSLRSGAPPGAPQAQAPAAGVEQTPAASVEQPSVYPHPPTVAPPGTTLRNLKSKENITTRERIGQFLLNRLLTNGVTEDEEECAAAIGQFKVQLCRYETHVRYPGEHGVNDTNIYNVTLVTNATPEPWKESFLALLAPNCAMGRICKQCPNRKSKELRLEILKNKIHKLNRKNKMKQRAIDQFILFNDFMTTTMGTFMKSSQILGGAKLPLEKELSILLSSNTIKNFLTKMVNKAQPQTPSHDGLSGSDSP